MREHESEHSCALVVGQAVRREPRHVAQFPGRWPNVMLAPVARTARFCSALGRRGAQRTFGDPRAWIAHQILDRCRSVAPCVAQDARPLVRFRKKLRQTCGLSSLRVSSAGPSANPCAGPRCLRRAFGRALDGGGSVPFFVIKMGELLSTGPRSASKVTPKTLHQPTKEQGAGRDETLALTDCLGNVFASSAAKTLPQGLC